MINTLSNNYRGAIQSYTKFDASNKLSDGTRLSCSAENTQTTNQVAQYDTLELSQEKCQVTLDVPDEITCEIPRTWTIMAETLKSFNDHLQWSFHQADEQNLSFGKRLTFLKEEGQKWVEEKRQNDPEMFVAWLQLNKDYIQKGEADLVGLPSDFSMQDYYSYIKKEQVYDNTVRE